MKLLVATHQTQGQRSSDFCFCTEGELVTLSMQCDRDANSDDSDSGCGCGRSLTGIETHKGTTTVKVAEFPDYDLERWRTAYAGAHQDAVPALMVKEYDNDLRSTLRRAADRFATVASKQPIGAVLELRKIDHLRLFNRRQT